MIIRLAYGKKGLNLHLKEEWDVQVIEPRFQPGLADSWTALQRALRSPIGSEPLANLVQSDDTVGIIFNDITRPTPNPLLLQVILSELTRLPRGNLRLFIALGTHRPNTDRELRTVLGSQACEVFTIVQNNAFDQGTQVCLGKTSQGNEIWLNQELLDCQVKILTGFIEPHFFAGFSGHGKAIMPGMAGTETILRNHSPQNIADPMATWGITWGNPIWEEIREVALQAGTCFLLNVTMNRNKEITGVFAGDLDQAHGRGCEYVRQTAMVAVEEPFDIVVTTNSGYPLDLNLYQSVKGMSAAAQVVREGGAIVCAAECWDGIPDHGLYGRLLKEARSPQALLELILAKGFLKQDSWQAQAQAQIQQRAEVYIHSENLTENQIRDALLEPAPSLENTLNELMGRFGRSARICVLPEGPQTIPYLLH